MSVLCALLDSGFIRSSQVKRCEARYSPFHSNHASVTYCNYIFLGALRTMGISSLQDGECGAMENQREIEREGEIECVCVWV